MQQDKLKLSFPTTFSRDFRQTLEYNFRIINSFIGGDSQNNFNKTLVSFKDELQKEVRAIVMAEESPVSANYELMEAREDTRGIKHQTLSQRIESDLQEVKKIGRNSDFVVTKNGTLMTNLLNKSSIKNVKKIVCIGDSVAKGLHSAKSYGDYLAEWTGAKLTNLAVSGATFSTASSNNIIEQAKKVSGADLVVIQGTDDDWLTGGGIPKGGVLIGSSPTDTASFYGAFCTIVNTVKRNNPHAKIIAMTATRQLPVTNRVSIRRKDTDTNKYNLNLEDYVNKQVLACTELDIPVFDAYHTDLIDPYNPAYRKKNMIDGLHPNELGHECIAYQLIKEYYWFYD